MSALHQSEDPVLRGRVLLLGPYSRGDRAFSIDQYLWVLESELSKRGVSVEVVRPMMRLNDVIRKPRFVSKLLGMVDKLVVFPFELRHRMAKLDREGVPYVVHVLDHAYAHYVSHLSRVPNVMTVHDLLTYRAALEGSPYVRLPWPTRWFQHMLLRDLRRAQHIICVSEATRDDCLRMTGVPVERTTVIHHCANYEYRPLAPEEARARVVARVPALEACPYFLHVGGNVWYKNRLGALAIFQGLRQRLPERDWRLVMVGQPFTEDMRRFIRANALDAHVTEQVSIAPEDLHAFYSQAEALIFPSFGEGFGWPVLEAQLCGCPVITSERAPMTEVSGGAALYIDPDRPEEAVERIAANIARLPELGREGLRNARRFHAERMVGGYIDVYRMLMAEHEGRAAAR